MNQTIYVAGGGRKWFSDLAHALHARCLADPVVSHAFSHGFHPQHAERLAAYWIESLGGPSDYTSSIGDESFVVRLHSGNGEHQEMDERAQVCFARALDDAGLPNHEALRATLKAYFRWATAAMAAYPSSAADVPPGLRLSRWSWGRAGKVIQRFGNHHPEAVPEADLRHVGACCCWGYRQVGNTCIVFSPLY